MRALASLTAVAMLLFPAAVRAEDAVLVLRSSDLAPYKAVEASFRAAIGQGVQTIGLGEPDAVDQFAKARPAARLVLAIGADAAAAAASVAGPAGQGLVVTVVPNPSAAVLASRPVVVPMFVPPAKQVRAIKAVLPQVKSVGLLYDPAQSKALAAECEAAATAAGLSLVRAEVANRAGVAEALRSLIGKVDVLWLVPDTTVIAADSFKLVMQISLAAKVPVTGFTAGMAKAGTLLAVDASLEEIGRRAAEAGKRLLAGQPAAGEGCDGSLYLNGKVAEMLGVAIPDAAKSQAAAVFQ